MNYKGGDRNLTEIQIVGKKEEVLLVIFKILFENEASLDHI